MDLVAGVRKEGSRGGRSEFKWEDVKDSQHRENYLGHSLMAPVGRWQKRKDLGWYAKGDDSQEAQKAANARTEEIRRIKEAERDALSAALGFAVEPRFRDSQLAGAKEVQKAIRESGDGEDETEGGKGLGFGGYGGAGIQEEETRETLIGYVGEKGGLEGGDAKVEKRRRDTSREREKERKHGRRRRHRSRSGEKTTRRRSRSRSHERRRDDERNSRYRVRSYSPRQRRHDTYRAERHRTRR